jgi:hypothetical protein
VGSTPPGTNRITNLDNFNLFLTELALRLVPLLVPFFSVLLLSTCDIIPGRDEPPKKKRGVFERVHDSGIWWMRYKVAGVEHREKTGSVLDLDCFRPVPCAESDVSRMIQVKSRPLTPVGTPQ